MPGFGAKTLIFEPSCIKAAMVIPDGGSSVLGAQRIVLCIRLTLLTEVRRKMRTMWCKTSKIVTNEHPMHSPEKQNLKKLIKKYSEIFESIFYLNLTLLSNNVKKTHIHHTIGKFTNFKCYKISLKALNMKNQGLKCF